MPETTPDHAIRRSPKSASFAPLAAVLLAMVFGLSGGYLDLVIMHCRKYFWSEERQIGSGRDFLWTVPIGHMALLLIPGVAVAALNRLRSGFVALRIGTWLLATLAIWAALLRMPLYGASTFVLAVGLGRLLSGAVAAHQELLLRYLRASLAALLGLAVFLAVSSSGRQAIREYRALSSLPPPQPNARNVVLMVWDTVRAHNLSPYGYPRNTSPNLARWARKGVRFNLALAPAPWTFPSHSCFFTGLWPFQLNSQWKFTLDASHPTLAGYLASRGYQTAGFAANTSYCSYETGLDRGFAHYEDYPLTPQSFLGRTIPGNWILNNFVSPSDHHNRKWIRFQSRDAGGINQAFLDWLPRRRPDRPFFAFLNYFDAHEPYFPPPSFAARSRRGPRSPRDYQFLVDYARLNKNRVDPADVLMARDSYDLCIAFLDEQLGRLLNELAAQRLLDNTLVIITSDHGEAFGDHQVFGHGTSVYMDEIAVPLVILSPDVQSGRLVTDPVSLRDLPATIVDQLGLSPGSPFPGHSLAVYWGLTPPPIPPETSPVLSEYANATAFQPHSEQGLSRRGCQLSLVAGGQHYVRDGMGTEQLFDLDRDAFEQVNLIAAAEKSQEAIRLRKMLLDVLAKNPGSIEVERAYLKPYREWLRSVVRKF
jgi:arylsulfatase A-like enzyme